MAHGGGGGPDFSLPDEILSVIPTDPYDQLDLARKITSMAIASRVTSLETDNGRFRQKLAEKDRLVEILEDKVKELESANQDVELRLKITREDNMKLLSERDSLAFTVKKLTRDLAKLETFKRQLMQSLNDDDSQHSETVDIVSYEQSLPPKAYPTNSSYEEQNGYQKYRSLISSGSSASMSDDVSKQTTQIVSTTPRLTPRLTPTGTPRLISASVSPRRYSTAVSPQRTSGTTSPRYEGRGSLSSWFPSSQQSSAANSPPPGRSLPGRAARIDGKEFFRQARSRLSLEQFSAFLANIKELNAQKQSREDTLVKAEEIFGVENKDLYASFQRLLSRDTH